MAGRKNKAGYDLKLGWCAACGISRVAWRTLRVKRVFALLNTIRMQRFHLLGT